MRNDNIAMLTDTLDICERGDYITETGRKVKLKLTMQQMKQCTVYLPDRIRMIDSSKKEAPARTAHRMEVSCRNVDTFTLARESAGQTTELAVDDSNEGRVLVLNLANPVHPGGGVRRGATAQEEDLCRKSSLLLSLEGSEAETYYKYNASLHTYMGSDALIITPDVEIIKDENGRLLDETVVVSVMTCAAPMLRNGMEGLTLSQYEQLVYQRIHGMLKVAASLGYRSLVLGAFGCGAFKNDAHIISDLFCRAIKKFTYGGLSAQKFFYSIDFAVLDRTDTQYNFKEFARNFLNYYHEEKYDHEQGYTFFWQADQENGCFSNWYASDFIIDDFQYFCAEQYMMSQKAKLFHDTQRYTAILRAHSARECKALGKLVTPFDAKLWDAVSYDVAKTANRAKYEQNPDLKKKLLDTGSSIIAEASPKDSIWGIGMERDKAFALQPDEWNGKNLLGKILMELREEFAAAFQSRR